MSIMRFFFLEKLKEEQTGIAGKQTAEIEALKQALAEKEEEVDGWMIGWMNEWVDG